MFLSAMLFLGVTATHDFFEFLGDRGRAESPVPSHVVEHVASLTLTRETNGNFAVLAALDIF